MGSATAINNASATIETLGDLSINAGTIHNTNEHLITRNVVVSTASLTEYQGSGAATRYLAGTPGVYIYKNESDHLRTPGGSYSSWLAYRYTRTTTETQVVASDPGKIVAGGAMTINAQALVNDNSRIQAGGALAANVTTLDNRELSGTRTSTDAGTVTSYWRDRRKGRDRTGSSTAAW